MNEAPPVRINFGSSGTNKPGFINVDIRASVNPDVIHDLNVFPYPFEDSSADTIELVHVLEHLDKPFQAMEEFHRILKPGGILYISVPHFSRGFTHTEHSHGFDVSFPYYFTMRFPNQFYGVEYKLASMRLNWINHITFRYLPELGFGRVTIWVLKVLDAIFSALGNASPFFCSRIWCFWVGGFEELEFRFIKPN
jgi:SAM-dependent methyltransferase